MTDPDKCTHPPHRLFSGWYKNIKEWDYLWVNCCECGANIRIPPVFIEEEAKWKEQQKGRET